MLETESDFLEA